MSGIFKSAHVLVFMIAVVLVAFPLSPSLCAQDDDEDVEIITMDEDEFLPDDEEEDDIDEIEDIEEVELEMDDVEEPEPTIAATAVPSMSMREAYRQGIVCYKQKKYDLALEYLTKSCTLPGGVDWLYGEAHAMRGIIYQYFSKDPEKNKKAYAAYRNALEFDKKNKTARKHVYQVEGK